MHSSKRLATVEGFSAANVVTKTCAQFSRLVEKTQPIARSHCALQCWPALRPWKRKKRSAKSAKCPPPLKAIHTSDTVQTSIASSDAQIWASPSSTPSLWQFSFLTCQARGLLQLAGCCSRPCRQVQHPSPCCQLQEYGERCLPCLPARTYKNKSYVLYVPM